MKIVKLTESLSVSGQITTQDVAEIAAQGYDIIVNNRPDQEEDGQPAGANIAEAAAAAGMEYRHLPVTAKDFPGSDFNAMAEILGDEQQRVLAFCRTGTRCTNLWVVSRQEQERDAAIEVARQNGYDLSMATAHSERQPFLGE